MFNCRVCTSDRFGTLPLAGVTWLAGRFGLWALWCRPLQTFKSDSSKQIPGTRAIGSMSACGAWHSIPTTLGRFCDLAYHLFCLSFVTVCIAASHRNCKQTACLLWVLLTVNSVFLCCSGMWWGIFLSCSASLRGWELLCVFSPCFVTFLLLRVSGVPILRKTGLKRWGHLREYQEYIKKTPLLVPLPRPEGHFLGRT